MMKTSGRVASCCVALFFALTSVSAVQKKLDSINDLKKINFGQSVPKHSLLLLHWFANTVDIDNNNVIRLTFDPNSGDYGSHHYGNFEGLLDPLPWGNGYRYYTIGNLNQETSMSLPSYVLHPQREYTGRNRDRIIIRVRQQNTGGRAAQRIDQVYLTQHYDASENLGTRYDPAHTYMITANLLRLIREFSVGQNQLQLLRNRFESNADVFQLRYISITWGNLAALGLLLFIVIDEKTSLIKGNNKPENNNRPENRRNSRTDGNRSNVPREVRNQGHVVVDFYNNDEDQESSRTTENSESDGYNTSVCWNNIQCSSRRIFCICCIATVCVILLCVILYFSLRPDKTVFTLSEMQYQLQY